MNIPTAMPPIPEGWTYWGPGPLPFPLAQPSTDVAELRFLEGGRDYWNTAHASAGNRPGVILILRDGSVIRSMAMSERVTSQEMRPYVASTQLPETAPPPGEPTFADLLQAIAISQIRNEGKRLAAEADPHGIPANAPGAKLDAGKTKSGLLLGFSRALEAVAEVATHRAAKYTEDGWQEVPDAEKRYRHAAMRHLLKMEYEDIDPKSGLPHEFHYAWNVIACLELRLRREQNHETTPSQSS